MSYANRLDHGVYYCGICNRNYLFFQYDKKTNQNTTTANKHVPKRRSIKQKIKVAIIQASRAHLPSPDGSRDLHVTTSEILKSLIENNYIQAGEYTLEDIFSLCLELHSQGELYLIPQDGNATIETWKFSKRALK